MDVDAMLPQVAQGALAVECRADDVAMVERLATIDDAVVHAAINAERAYLALLGGGCTLPCGAWARPGADGALVMDVFLASEDGEIALRAAATQGDGDTPEALGEALGAAILAQGGDELVALDQQVHG